MWCNRSWAVLDDGDDMGDEDVVGADAENDSDDGDDA